jgi:hypothetical protein
LVEAFGVERVEMCESVEPVSPRKQVAAVVSHILRI